jgi:hypothetical protein
MLYDNDLMNTKAVVSESDIHYHSLKQQDPNRGLAFCDFSFDVSWA